MKLVCLCRQDNDQVPSSASVKETLLQAGLGERSGGVTRHFLHKGGVHADYNGNISKA